jgi:glycosyltransferase involved in cell wall biosynthesis
MRVLMFGWEFPPFYSGGLGTACYGLTKGLSHHNVKVTFVMPKGPDTVKSDFVKLLVADKAFKNHNFRIKKIDSILTPYLNSQTYNEKFQDYSLMLKKQSTELLYGKNMFEEVYRFSEQAKLIALSEEFDVIHAHDWMTYMAGIKAKKVSGKPLVVHMHATEFDRTGGNGINQYVYDIEKRGMHEADKVCAVSNYTKSMVVQHYGVPPEKVEVVHNAVEFSDRQIYRIEKTDKVVLFLGRITLQKGPEYFVEAAKKVMDRDPNVKFVVVGSGDMEPQMIEHAASLGIANRMLFAGFLTGEDVNKAYQMADIYVMPSVSEPFGITPLEAMKSGTPVIISKQSGVSEVIQNCLKVDFWDVDDIANKILSLLHYETLHQTLKHHGTIEVDKFNWDIPAEKCLRIYNELVR